MIPVSLPNFSYEKQAIPNSPSGTEDFGEESNLGAIPQLDNEPKTGSVINKKRIIRWPEVHSATARSRTQVWRDVKAGKFPAPVQLGENAVGWYEDEIATWLESRPRASYAK